MYMLKRNMPAYLSTFDMLHQTLHVYYSLQITYEYLCFDCSSMVRMEFKLKLHYINCRKTWLMQMQLRLRCSCRDFRNCNVAAAIAVRNCNLKPFLRW